VDALQRLGRGGLIGDMLKEATGSAARGAEPATPQASGEWRSTPLPLYWDGDIQRIILHTRPDDGGGENEDGRASGTRFIFDLTLPRMGDVQVDGLMRERRLDLVVRTHAGLSEPMQQAMRKSYAGALEGSDLYGELFFQTDTRHWVQV